MPASWKSGREADWGHARDYVRAMWMMLQQEKPEDFVIATGVQHSVREFVEFVCRELGSGFPGKARVRTKRVMMSKGG